MQRLDLERRLARLQELPVAQELLPMDFRPGFNEPLLGSGEIATDALDDQERTRQLRLDTKRENAVGDVVPRPPRTFE